MKLSELKMIDLARQLTLALADEVTHHGSENCSEASLKILAIAVSRLGLLEEYQEIWKLNSRKAELKDDMLAFQETMVKHLIDTENDDEALQSSQ